MEAVIQEEKTGCAIASSAAISGMSYQEAKSIANSIGIYASDSSLWSESIHICNILKKIGIETECKEISFTKWSDLPSCALLATKWHIENNKPYWHWAVFVRDGKSEYVLDSNASLEQNKITNLSQIKPKWYIKVNA